MSTEKKESENEDVKVSQSLSDEIDGAVNDTMSVIKQEREERDLNLETNLKLDEVQSGVNPKGGKTPKAEHEDDNDEGVNKIGDKEPDAVTDESLERAVKAGVPMAEAKKYTSKSMLEFVCAKLEDLGKKPGEGQKEKVAESSKDDPELQALLEGLPDLDPEEYDEKIVGGFKAMKDVIRKQYEATKSSKEKNSEKSWFDSQVSGLGDAIEEEIEKSPGTRTALKEQFDVLTAGYKAAGKTVDQETIFDQSVAVVLREVSAKVADSDRAEKLRKRSGQQIRRPNSSAASPSGDVFNEVAADLDRKYFDKK